MLTASVCSKQRPTMYSYTMLQYQVLDITCMMLAADRVGILD